MTAGWISVAGLGPGDAALVTPEVTAALAEATDVVGYIPYVARVAPRDGLTLHPSDNRVELDRAGFALDLAAQGRRVVIVAEADGFLGGFERAESSQHDDGKMRIDLPNTTQSFNAGDAGHSDVEDDRVGFFLVQQLQTDLDRVGRMHLIARL